MIIRPAAAALFAGVLLSVSAALAEAPVKPVPGIAMHGAPKYAPGFGHFDYVNPEAPKGGELRMAAIGTFDSYNQFVLKGNAAPNLGLIYQTLMIGSEDEAFSRYGMIAETIETPEDRSWVAFNLRKEAKWHDGQPITADDVVWTFNTLMTKGHPSFRAYYASVDKAVAESPTRVKFTFKMKGNRELPLILGEMVVLPKHFWEGKGFETDTATLPLGSGPYKIKTAEPGKRIVYERVKDWWAKDLPEAKGGYNFDTISYDMYRDPTVALQAFFSGNADLRQENIAKAWFEEYDNQPPVKDGRIKKEEIKHSLPTGMQAFVFNTRRPLFSDIKVREALNYTFDFEWSNKQFAHGGYKRTNSYFANSELASSGVPEGAELEILNKFKDQLPAELFTKAFVIPKTSGSGTDMRQNLATAKRLLEEDGWKLGASGLLEKNGQPLKFEILADSPTFERWTAPMVGNMKKIGVLASLRYVDDAQYQKRLDDFDFDMTITTFGQSLSPGNEQRDFWSSAKADVRGSRNLMGIKNPVVDQLIDLIISAPDREQLIARTHALDRVLLWSYYVIPQWYLDASRVAYWDKYSRPATAPKYDPVAIATWWYDPAKAAKLDKKARPEAK